MTHSPFPSRRLFLSSTAAALVTAPALKARAEVKVDDTFVYEVTRTEAEWRERLTDEEYFILRDFGTERRFSSEYWDKEDAGHYACKGCDLPIYKSDWKTLRAIGWVFFFHAEPDTVLTGIDEWPMAMTNAEGVKESKFVTEAHCRRCGSHLGHILIVQEDLLHCINGAALNFVAAEA